MSADRLSSEKSSGAEQRRSSRFPVVVPMEIEWREASGAAFQEKAQATEVNAHGALLRMRSYPSTGVEAELTNLLTGVKKRARVAALRRTRSGEIQGVAVALAEPD